MARLVVDAMNVIGSRPDGWWRDRDGAVRRLLTSLQRLASTSGDRVALVVDGRPLAGVAEGDHDGVQVHYARRAGRDAADDRIVELVGADADPSTLAVVTSDRDLANRTRALGATVSSVRALRDRLDAIDRDVS